jgi:hypothetical protein
MKYLGPASANSSGEPLVSISVTFGEQFKRAKPTNAEFSRVLRVEAQRHMNGFLGPMMQHFADHIDASIEQGSKSATAPANLMPLATYNGPGSCSDCGEDKCCRCAYDTDVWCEVC